jgi:hypothetical protein
MTDIVLATLLGFTLGFAGALFIDFLLEVYQHWRRNQ